MDTAEKSKQDTPQPVYHYCSLDVLTKIAASRSIRMTEVFSTNDKMEYLWFLRGFLKVMCAQTRDIFSESSNGDVLNSLVCNFYEAIYDETSREYFRSPEDIIKFLKKHDIYQPSMDMDDVYSSIYEWRKNPPALEHFRKKTFEVMISISERFPDEIISAYNEMLAFLGVPHIACFSLEKDMLTQWRNYADDGSGVAIGFNQNHLLKVVDSEPYPIHVISGKVEYLKDDENACLPKLDIDLKKIFLDLGSSEKISEQQKRSIQRYLFQNCPFHKDPCFELEKEWRICSYVGVLNGRVLCRQGKPDDGTIRYSDIRANYCESHGRLRSYFDLPIPKDTEQSSAINKVMLGPNCKAEISDVYLMLRRYDFKINEESITRSQGSYRC